MRWPTLRPVRHAFSTLGLIALAACSGAAGPTDDSSEAVTSVPETSARDQKDTGNCWLYATAGWVESLEYSAAIARGEASASDPTTRPQHVSVAYWDYWDWYTKITTGAIKGKKAAALKDGLDSGGSWGAAVEIAKRYGVARSRSLLGDGNDAVHNEADKTLAALGAMVKSLSTGALSSAAARKDGARVRKELDAAFGFVAGTSDAFTAAFGADGKKTFETGDAVAGDVVKGPADIAVRVPRPGKSAETVTLVDLIGERAKSDDPDGRVGPRAWSVVPFEAKTPAETRAYFRRIQRALNDGVPLPISWYVASNGDDGHEGQYKTISPTPADADNSGGHETLIDDYEVNGVPGFGRLAAGTPASDEAKRAALDDAAHVVFLRVKNSWGTKANAFGPAGYNDLYFDYLTGKMRVCPAKTPATSKKCTDQIPLEDVTLPAGY